MSDVVVKVESVGGPSIGVDDQSVIKGDDGFSPVVSFEQIEGGNKLIIVDANGPHEANILNGAPGQDGDPGADGQDGTSPAVTFGVISGGHTMTVTDKTHPTGQTINIMDGDTGPQGPQGPQGETVDDYVLVQSAEPTSETNRIWVKPIATPIMLAEMSDLCCRNLLDNGYFVGGGSQQGGGQFPINQRGLTIYSNAGYCIDRWFSTASGVELTIITGEIAITQSSESSWEMIYQKIENYKKLAGKTVTLSVYGYREGKYVSASIQDNSNTTYDSFTIGTELQVYSKSIVLPPELNNGLVIRFFPDGGSSGTTTLHLKAIKLELGSEQTLAHQKNGDWVINEIPDYGEELSKCQRYYQLFRTESLRPTYGEDCRPTMATEQPTKGTLTKGGVTYYTLSSEP